MSLPDINFMGIQLYDIDLNGCLNGVYTNIPAKGRIYNEIARKMSSKENEELEIKYNDKIVGDYNCRWFDLGNAVGGYILEIRKLEIRKREPTTHSVYTFRWRTKNGIPKFEGIGYKMNERQIAVSYWLIS